ncbi:MAG: hypothetical protein AAGA60_31000 [Cyanobacteria bacterium P01_E01_bin.42]
MLEIIKQILGDHLSEILWASSAWLFSQAANRWNQEKKLRQKVQQLEKRIAEIFEQTSKEKEDFVLQGFDKIAKENFEDIAALEEKLEKKQEIIDALGNSSTQLKEQLIARDAKISQLEIEAKSFRIYIDIIISFIGDKKRLEKKILNDPDFRRLMRDKDIDKILAEVGTIQQSKPRRSFRSWFDRLNMLVTSLAILKGLHE